MLLLVLIFAAAPPARADAPQAAVLARRDDLFRQALAARKAGRVPLVIERLSQALDANLAVNGEVHAYAALRHSDLASWHERRDWKKAVAHYEAAVRIWEALAGPDGPHAVDASWAVRLARLRAGFSPAQA